VLHNKKLVKASDAISAAHEKMNEKETALVEQITKIDFGPKLKAVCVTLQ
jgi:hypothetical protein